LFEPADQRIEEEAGQTVERDVGTPKEELICGFEPGA
jgi:hypothetical protein